MPLRLLLLLSLLPIPSGCDHVQKPGSNTDTDTDTAAVDDAGSDTALSSGTETEGITTGCGDRVLVVSEACDDGNTSGGDGCSTDCLQVEVGYSCRVPGQPCETVPICGDGLVTHNERCDPGPDSDTSCTWFCEPADVCSDSDVPCAPATCGNGLVEGFEQCDDGNNPGGYGQCAPDCRLDNYCGDGIIQDAYEDCDDGNGNNHDLCATDCRT